MKLMVCRANSGSITAELSVNEPLRHKDIVELKSTVAQPRCYRQQGQITMQAATVQGVAADGHRQLGGRSRCRSHSRKGLIPDSI